MNLLVQLSPEGKFLELVAEEAANVRMFVIEEEQQEADPTMSSIVYGPIVEARVEKEMVDTIFALQNNFPVAPEAAPLLETEAQQ